MQPAPARVRECTMRETPDEGDAPTGRQFVGFGMLSKCGAHHVRVRGREPDVARYAVSAAKGVP